MVIRDLTLRSAASFGSFHLIRLLYDEYMFYLIEHKVAKSSGKTTIAVMSEVSIYSDTATVTDKNIHTGTRHYCTMYTHTHTHTHTQSRITADVAVITVCNPRTCMFKVSALLLLTFMFT